MTGKKNELTLDIDPEVAKGVYSNYAVIAHSHAEFIVDIGASLPSMPNPRVVSRVILAPEHAKRLMFALQENVQRYEQEFGIIQLSNPPAQTPPRTANPFGSSQGEA